MTYFDYQKYAAQKKRRGIGSGIENQRLFTSGLGGGIGYAIGKHISRRSLSPLFGGIMGLIIGSNLANAGYKELFKKDLTRYNRAMQRGTVDTRHTHSNIMPMIGIGVGAVGTGHAIDYIRRYMKGRNVLSEARDIISKGGKAKFGIDKSRDIIAKFAQQSYDYPQSQPQSYVDQANVEDIRKKLLQRYKMDTLKGRALTTATGLGTGAGVGLLYGKYREAAGKAFKHKGGVIGGLALLGAVGANKIFSAGQSILKNYMSGE